MEVFERLMGEGVTEKKFIKAGLTGPFQSLKDDHTASANLLDRWYVNFVTTRSGYAIILNDIRIIFRTLLVILKAKGI